MNSTEYIRSPTSRESRSFGMYTNPTPNHYRYESNGGHDSLRTAAISAYRTFAATRWIEAKISRRLRLSKVTAACPRCEGRYRPLALGLAAMAGLSNYVKRWRTPLHVISSAFIAATLGLGIAPVAHAAAVTATLTVEHTWQTGFIARYSITNASVTQLSDWRLEFDLPVGEGLSHTWNSSFAQSGTHFVITPANWNRTIEPGGSATGGMRGVLTGSYSPPVNCRINGLPCT